MVKQICPNKKENEKECPCPELDCENHGLCCECIKYHRGKGGKPACLR